MPLQLSDTIPASNEPCLFTLESAAQFVKMLKQCDKFIASCLTVTSYSIWQ